MYYLWHTVDLWPGTAMGTVSIDHFFTINNIRDVDIAKIVIARGDTATRISLDYEKRFAMFGNVDVVLSFSNQYDSAE